MFPMKRLLIKQRAPKPGDPSLCTQLSGSLAVSLGRQSSFELGTFISLALNYKVKRGSFANDVFPLNHNIATFRQEAHYHGF